MYYADRVAVIGQFIGLLQIPYRYNLAEILFWKRVHKGKFHKIDFDRQKVIGSYIVDFYVKRLSLIVEIDGLSHVGKEKYDIERQGYLESLGLIVYRIKDARVLNDIENVMWELEEFVCRRFGKTTWFCGQGRTTPPCGHPSRGGE